MRADGFIWRLTVWALIIANLFDGLMIPRTKGEQNVLITQNEHANMATDVIQQKLTSIFI